MSSLLICTRVHARLGRVRVYRIYRIQKNTLVLVVSCHVQSHDTKQKLGGYHTEATAYADSRLLQSGQMI